MSDEKKLTDQQVDKICESMEDVKNESHGLKVVADLPSNNGVEKTEAPEEGYSENVTIAINPNSGMSYPTKEKTFNNGSEAGLDNILNKDPEIDTEVNIEIDDIKDQLSKNDDFFNDLNLNDEDIVRILKITKRVQNGEKFKVFKELPESVQKKIWQYSASAGFGDKSPKSNEFRNDIADLMISEFISNISMEKYAMDFQKEMNEIENKVNKEFSKMFLDYNENRDSYVNALVEKYGDDGKKALLSQILDSINDGFALERIKDAARNHRIKIKKFDLEKPKRCYDAFEGAYYKSTYNIYSIYMAHNALERHMANDIEDKDDIKRFFVAIAKFCSNYKPENVVEHAFMYYAMYNPLLLDVYKGEEYQSFASRYKANVLEVIRLLKIPREDQK